jgi:hypothetical protein
LATRLGFAGSEAEAEEIKEQLRKFLQEELKLEMSQEKTLITQARTRAARFLGYEIATQQANDKLDRNKVRNVNGRMELRVPKDVNEKNCAKYQKDGKPMHRAELTLESDFAITEKYQSKYRGLVQYYVLAVNVSSLKKLHWTMKRSLLKTLANKHKSSVRKMVQKYQTKTETRYGKMLCLEVRIDRGDKKPLVARFGGIPLRRQKEAIILDVNPDRVVIRRNELVKRLLRDSCELCGSKEHISVHHVRKMSDLKKKGRKEKPLWEQVMIAMRRKTLVVCGYCHWAIHTGTPTRQPENGMGKLESRVR